VIRRLAYWQLRVKVVSDMVQAEDAVRQHDAGYELIIINVSDPSQRWLLMLAKLQNVSRGSGAAWPPLVLCLSTRKHDLRFQLEIERKGARYVFER